MAALGWLTESVAAEQAAWRGRVAAFYRGEPVDRPIVVAGRFYGPDHGLWGTAAVDPLAEPDAWLDAVLADLAAHVAEGADARTFRPLAIELDLLGTHFVDAVCGARVELRGGQFWSHELAVDPAAFRPPELAGNPVLEAALELARRAVARTGGRLLIALPVFSCPANVGISLFGQRLLEALALRPEAARRALGAITETIAGCLAAFRAVVPAKVARNSVVSHRYAPAGHGQIDGCATQLVSARHYAEFLAPLDAALLRCWPRPGLIHLCGAHEHHLPAWAALPELASVQLNDRATDGLPDYLAHLRADQILYLSPTATWPLERLRRACAGRRVIWQVPLGERS